MMLLILIPTYKIAQTLKTIVNWKSAQLLWNFDEASAIETYRNIQPMLVNNPSFLFNYGVQLMNMRMYEKAYPILKLSTQRLNSIATFTQLGLCARELNIANEPEQYYLKATYIAPNRLTPKLDLLNFYIFSRNRVKAEIIAEEILHTPVKIPSAEADTIKLVAKKYLMDKR